MILIVVTIRTPRNSVTHEHEKENGIKNRTKKRKKVVSRTKASNTESKGQEKRKYVKKHNFEHRKTQTRETALRTQETDKGPRKLCLQNGKDRHRL